MAEEEVGLRLALKNRREVTAGLDDVGDKLNRAGDEADRAGRKARIAAGGLLTFSRAGRVAGRAAVYGVGAASAGVVGVGLALAKLSKDSIGEARDAQKVGALTTQVIKSTGGAANVSAKQVGNLATAISNKIGVDDEAIQSGENLLLTFKNVRNESGKGNDVFNQATQAYVDMAAGMAAASGGAVDYRSSVTLIGKALNDPIKGLSALSRVGVTFTAGQQAQIKAMVGSNKTMDAQKLILGELRSEFGGAAEAQATWGDKAKVSIGNIEESIGTALLPMLDRTERWFVQKGSPAIEHWVGVFEKRGIPVIERGVDLFERKAVPAIGTFLDEARPLAASVIPAIGTGLGAAADAFRVIAPRAKAVFDAFNDLPDWAKEGIALGALGGVAAKKIGASSLLGKSGLLGAVSKAKPLPVVVVNPRALRGSDGVVTDPTTGERRTKTSRGSRIKRGLRSPGAAGAILGGLSTLDDVQQIYNNPFGELKDELLWPWTDGPFAPKKVHIARMSAQAQEKALHQLFFGPLQPAKELNGQIVRIDKAKPRPVVQTAGMLGALNSESRIVGLLAQIDKAHARPAVYVDGIGTAELRLASFRSKLEQLNAVRATPGLGLSAAPRANGGPVRAGEPYVVGERRPELFVPRVDGYVRPKLPDLPSLEDWSPSSRSPFELRVYLDGKEITHSVKSHLQDEMAFR